MFKVGDMVRVKRELLEDGDSEYLDRILWVQGEATAVITRVWHKHPAEWNNGPVNYDVEVHFVGGTEWGCHMRAVFPAMLDKSSISWRLVELYRV